MSGRSRVVVGGVKYTKAWLGLSGVELIDKVNGCLYQSIAGVGVVKNKWAWLGISGRIKWP